MKLSQQRILFSRMVFRLLREMDESPLYDYALDFVKRCPDCKVGATYSKHKEGLAVDIHLYLKDGDYQGDEKGEEKAHDEFGAFWKSIGGSWGGDFPGDANHYSLGE